MSASDNRVASLASATAVVMIAQQIAGKATRDTLFLTNYAAREVPNAMLLAAGLAMGSVLVLSRVMSWTGPRRLVPLLFLISGALFAAEGQLYEQAPRVVSMGVYLHIALFGSAVLSGFWSVVNERFDPHAAKKFIGRIAAGATFGGVVGGVIAERVASIFGPTTLLPVLAGLNIVCALGVARIGRGSKELPREAKAGGGLQVLRGSGYLQRVAAVVVLLALVGALLDYALKAQADLEFDTAEGLAGFFSYYYMGLGLLTFVVQSIASKRSLARLGIGGSLALMPLAVLGFGGIGVVATRLLSVVGVRGAASVLENSIHRSGYELLYTPVAPQQKRPTKMLIDVAGNRLGDALGSAVVLGLLAVLSEAASVPWSIGVSMGLAIAALGLILRLQRGYVAQLEASLRSGQVVLDEDASLDATTRRTLAETTMALDREKLLAEIAALRKDRLETSEAEATVDERSPLEVLRSEDARGIRRLLNKHLDPALVPEVVNLLDGPHRSAASKALRRTAPRHLGTLVDAMVDPSRPLAQRCELPRVIATVGSERARWALLEALKDPRFELRYRAGLALAALCRRNPELCLPQEDAFALARREVNIDRKVWESQRSLGPVDEETDALGALLRTRRDRSLEHVFNLLGLALDRDTMRLSLAALSREDSGLRGTALEFLDNVLPEDLRDGLWPYIADAQLGGKRRSREEIVDELLRSMESLQIDRQALLKGVAARVEDSSEN